MAATSDKSRIGPSIVLAKTPCPYCQKVLDRVACVTREPGDDFSEPTVGTVTLCNGCGNWLKFGVGMTLEELTDADIMALSPEQFLMLAELGRALHKVRKLEERRTGKRGWS